MGEISGAELAQVNSFPALVSLLRDKLDWPIGDEYGFDDIVYEYEADDLGLKPDEIAKIREIHQLRPLVTGQPWGIFFISFEEKVISVTVLRRLLRALVVKKRAGAQTPDRQVWQLNDLIFVANFGRSGEREIAVAHFSDAGGDLPVLNVLGWNAKDTKLHNVYVGQVLSERLRWPDDTDDVAEWRDRWSGAFELRLGQVAQTAQELARQLATLASSIRSRANELLAAEAEAGQMRTMLAAFRKNLIHDLDDDGFADMFAQTIAYGLLAARISRPIGIVADNLADMVPKTNPFLKELFATFLKIGGRDRRQGMDFDELGVRDVVAVLNLANMDAVLRDFGDRNPKEDPVIHFYELFLKEYDPKKRMQRGVFYTPRPVVSFIVRGVDEILRTEFGLPLGLADTSTWAEVAARNDHIKVPEHVEPDAPFVQILDPATGTGTFLVEAIDLIHKRMTEHWVSQGRSADELKADWNAYVPAHLLPRLTAFELMMAPYTIAHMKVGLKLSETGYEFGSEERARIFLTNALEPARELDKEFAFMSEALAHEALASNEAKAATPFTVVVGNPPYSNFSSNLTDQAKAFVERVRYFAGTAIKERNQLQFERNINDDYVKFVSLASIYSSRSAFACVGLVTNSTFMKSDSLRGLREWQEEIFARRRVVDLHGASVRGSADVAHDDENIFDIEQGVAVSLFSAHGSQADGWEVYDLEGPRAHKYNWLLGSTLSGLKFRRLTSSEQGRLLPDEALDLNQEFVSFVGLEAIQPLYSEAIKTGRDWLVTDIDESVLLERMVKIQEATSSDDELSAEIGLNVKKAWDLTKARSALKGQKLGSFIRDFDYRPFDRRKLFYHASWISSPASPVMQNFVGDGQDLGLLIARKSRSEVANLYWCTDIIADKGYCSSVDNVSAFPLWLKPTVGEISRRPNINRRLATTFAGAIGLTYLDGISQGESTLRHDLASPSYGSADSPWNGRGDLEQTMGPRDLFDYTYAVLQSLGYRTRYSEFLKSDFPRIPTPKHIEMFAAIVELGRRLVAFHLVRLEDAPKLKAPGIRFAGTGASQVASGYPKYENGKVMINASRWFEDVPQATWEFHVGGYQVCEKWLKDRAGKGGKNPSPSRVLTEEDIVHYRRLVAALTETRQLIGEIDATIEVHGGWPGAFSVGPNEGAAAASVQ